MTTTTYNGLTASELQQRAADKRQRAEESWERSDTDGFLSQWASDLGARLDDLNAEALELGGLVPVGVLVDKDGNIVPARIIETRYGPKWAIFQTADEANAYDGKVIQWVSLGERALKKHGLEMRHAYAPGHWELRGKSYTNVGPRAIPDQRFPTNAAVIEE